MNTVEHIWSLVKYDYSLLTDDVNFVTLFHPTKGRASKESLLRHKSIVFFPGSATTTDNSEALSAYGAMIFNALVNHDVVDEDVAIYLVPYTKNHTTSYRIKLLEKHHQLDYLKIPFSQINEDDMTDMYSFFQEYLLPLIYDESNKPYPIDKIKENLDNITFMGHCHGGLVIKDMEEYFEKELQKIYPESYLEILNHFKAVHLASRSYFTDKAKGKHLHIISQNDKQYVDKGILGHQNILHALHNFNMPQESMAFQINSNEVILLFNKINIKLKDSDDHKNVLRAFYMQPTTVFQDIILRIKNFLNATIRHTKQTKPTQQGTSVYKAGISLWHNVFKQFIFMDHPNDSLIDLIKKTEQSLFFKKSVKTSDPLLAKFYKHINSAQAHVGALEDLSRQSRLIISSKQTAKKILQPDFNGSNFYLQLFNQYKNNAPDSQESLSGFLSDYAQHLPVKALVTGLIETAKREDMRLFNLYKNSIIANAEDEIRKNPHNAYLPLKAQDYLLIIKHLPDQISSFSELFYCIRYSNRSEMQLVLDTLSKYINKNTLKDRDFIKTVLCFAKKGKISTPHIEKIRFSFIKEEKKRLTRARKIRKYNQLRKSVSFSSTLSL